MRTEKDTSVAIFIRQVQHLNYLSKEEELELFYKYKQHKDKKALEKLLSCNWRIILKMANKYTSVKGNGLSLSDLIQEASIGFIRAMDKFDPERGMKPSGFAIWYMKTHLNLFAIKNFSVVNTGIKHDMYAQLVAKDKSKQKHHFSKDTSLDTTSFGSDDKEGNAWIGQVEDNLGLVNETKTPEDEFLYNEKITQVQEAINKLEPYDSFVLTERYIENKTLDEVGQKRGVTKERIRQVEERALSRIKEKVQHLATI